MKKFLIAEGNVFASAEIYYSFGAIFSGLLILRLFKKVKTVFAVIILMSIASLSYYYLVFVDFLWYFFLANFLIGITNAGVRILRTTYIFNHVPNNLIGRTNSVFGTLNIVVRMLLIGILSFFFFSDFRQYKVRFFCRFMLNVTINRCFVFMVKKDSFL